MSMRTLHAAYKAVCVIGGFLFIWVLTVPAQQAERDSRLENLFSSDPAVHGAAKTALLGHPDPALLPVLLQALQAATGTTRDDLLEILAKYDDTRKIPVLLAMEKKSLDAGGGTLGIDDQLSRLGAPAAEALLANCPNDDNNYPYWAGGVIGQMHEIGARFLIQAVQSDDKCQHSVGDYGLSFMFGDADPNSISRADIHLAIAASIETMRESARQPDAGYPHSVRTSSTSTFLASLTNSSPFISQELRLKPWSKSPVCYPSLSGRVLRGSCAPLCMRPIRKSSASRISIFPNSHKKTRPTRVG